jgi:hypothetical protein
MEAPAMHFVDDEFLLLSRGGRFSPGTHKRLARELAGQDARRELVALQKKRKQTHPAKVKVTRPFTAVLRGARRRGYGVER